jgi:hypothetical protein
VYRCELVAKVPRTWCRKDGVHQVQVPWARKKVLICSCRIMLPTRLAPTLPGSEPVHSQAGDRLEGVRETLALAIEELDRKLNEHERPEFWELLSELMFRASRKASGGSDLRLRNQVIVSSNQWSVIRTPSFLFFPS